ncbi:hypothetical protein [Nonomuraea jiangxiensis]|uniref:Thiazole-containing bacteriocin maturation protein n=1 Tax=Nonomuraea jiangxiensis TaxID=633440 RepID=A0A1G9P326_9ACTN|nr:hypothetical protein [Nonomuraea jiangxiensis]SDL92961.1 hypothetical protein SAMN05421869_13313 [Nonomuraea jiangxiensis]
MGALPNLDAAMRPRLRDDVRFVECPDGAYVHSDYGACTLRGRQAYDWLARLAPALTGRHTLAELSANLPGDKRAMVESLVSRLAEQRFVVDDRHARPHGLTGAELRAYAEEIAFIGYALDSPEARFERIRSARLVLAGAGPLLEALAGACAGTGWRSITVISPDGAAAGRAANAARRDPGQQIRTLSPDGDALGRAIAGDADVVLQVSADLHELVATARAGEAGDVVLGQALVGPAEVWLSRVGRPSVTAAASGWHRLAALPAAGPASSDEDWLTGPVPTVVAAMLALACFSHVTGLDTDQELLLTRVDLRNLDTLPHRFLARPRTGARPGTGQEAIRERAAALATAPPIEAESLLGLATELVDSRLGLLGMLDEQALAQSPLAVCQATVSDPFGALPGWAPPPRVFGWGPDQRTARLRCLLAALGTYGVLAVGPDADEGVVWGVELPEGRPRPVPASELRLTGLGTSRPPVGTGAGLSWTEALAAGLRARCEHLLATRADHAAPTGPEGANGMGAPVGPIAEALLRQLVLAGEPPWVRDHTPVLGVPAFSLTVPGQETVVSVAATAPAALRDGLERLLLRWQSRTARQHAYAEARPFWPPDGDAPEAVRTMAGALRRAGKVPVAVPLDEDPEAARLLPFVTYVALLDD